VQLAVVVQSVRHSIPTLSHPPSDGSDSDRHAKPGPQLLSWVQLTPCTPELVAVQPTTSAINKPTMPTALFIKEDIYTKPPVSTADAGRALVFRGSSASKIGRAPNVKSGSERNRTKTKRDSETEARRENSGQKRAARDGEQHGETRERPLG
jgi:hypothetical protein